MFNNTLKIRVKILEQQVKLINNSHAICEHCNIIGHKRDMYEETTHTSMFYVDAYRKYYHHGCYAEKFNKHLCPNKCGKWIDNRKKKKGERSNA